MYTYLLGALIFLGLWGILFALVPQSRVPMLSVSLTWGPAGPVSEYWHGQDYWHPTYFLPIEIGPWRFGLEDYLFAFAFGGLCAGVFDCLVRQAGATAITHFETRDYLALLFTALLCLVIMSLFILFFQINSLYALVLIFLGGALWILLQHPGWVLPAIQTALIMGSIMWLFYWGFYFRLFPHLLEQWWKKEALFGIFLWGVPLEEVLWATAAALFVGPLFRIYAEKTSLDQESQQNR